MRGVFQDSAKQSYDTVHVRFQDYRITLNKVITDSPLTFYRIMLNKAITLTTHLCFQDSTRPTKLSHLQCTEVATHFEFLASH